MSSPLSLSLARAVYTSGDAVLGSVAIAASLLDYVKSVRVDLQGCAHSHGHSTAKHVFLHLKSSVCVATDNSASFPALLPFDFSLPASPDLPASLDLSADRCAINYSVLVTVITANGQHGSRLRAVTSFRFAPRGLSLAPTFDSKEDAWRHASTKITLARQWLTSTSLAVQLAVPSTPMAISTAVPLIAIIALRSTSKSGHLDLPAGSRLQVDLVQSYVAGGHEVEEIVWSAELSPVRQPVLVKSKGRTRTCDIEYEAEITPWSAAPAFSSFYAVVSHHVRLSLVAAAGKALVGCSAPLDLVPGAIRTGDEAMQHATASTFLGMDSVQLQSRSGMALTRVSTQGSTSKRSVEISL